MKVYNTSDFHLVGVGGLAVILGVLYNSDIMQSFDHDKSSSISELIKGKLREISKHYADILKEQQLLCLISYY